MKRTMVLSGAGKSTQIFKALKLLARDYGYVTLGEIITERCKQ